jgi:hypothetical protein
MKNKSPAVRQYCQHLIQLHGLIGKEASSSEEADAVRDTMDTIWEKLKSNEITYCADFSASLSGIHSQKTRGKLTRLWQSIENAMNALQGPNMSALREGLIRDIIPLSRNNKILSRALLGYLERGWLVSFDALHQPAPASTYKTHYIASKTVYAAWAAGKSDAKVWHTVYGDFEPKQFHRLVKRAPKGVGGIYATAYVVSLKNKGKSAKAEEFIKKSVGVQKSGFDKKAMLKFVSGETSSKAFAKDIQVWSHSYGKF